MIEAPYTYTSLEMEPVENQHQSIEREVYI